MKHYRAVLAVLLVIPLGLLGYHFSVDPMSYDSSSMVELLYMVLGVPILVLNVWVWWGVEIGDW